MMTKNNLLALLFISMLCLLGGCSDDEESSQDTASDTIEEDTATDTSGDTAADTSEEDTAADTGEDTATDTDDDGPVTLASNDEMFEWVEELWRIGDEGFYGYRMPGSEADLAGQDYVEAKFREFGLVDVFKEPVAIETHFPTEWSLEVTADGSTMPVSSYFLRYSEFTPPEGVTGEMVYVGEGSTDEFDAAGDVSGKIVVVDVTARPTPIAALLPFVVYQYDPDGTLDGDNAYENLGTPNLLPAYNEADTRGAAGLVAILTYTVADNNQQLHWYPRTPDGSFGPRLPALSISPTEGDRLRTLLEAGSVEATLTLTGTEGVGTSYNVYGTVPGKNYGTDADEFIAVQSHQDGWATNDASGMAVVFALAQYYVQWPQESREYSILFFGYGSHFALLDNGIVGSFMNRTNPEHIYDLIQQGRVKFAAPIEMIGKQFKIVDRAYVETGLAAPRAFMVNPMLPESILEAAQTAIAENDYDRSSIIRGFYTGEPLKWSELVPMVGLISHNAPQFSNDDTPDTVMKSALSATAAVYVNIIDAAQGAF